MTWRRAVVVGASGGIGRALSEALEKNGTEVVRLSRSAEGSGRIDLEDEASIAQAADCVSDGGDVDLVLVASGILAPDEIGPEKSWRGIDPAAMARVFAVNAIGPALVAKHFVPLLPKDRRSAFAVLGARVGSIGDNRLGGVVFLPCLESGAGPDRPDAVDRTGANPSARHLCRASSGDRRHSPQRAVCA